MKDNYSWLDRTLGRVVQLWNSYCDEKNSLEQFPDIDSFLRHDKVVPSKLTIISQIEIEKLRAAISELDRLQKLYTRTYHQTITNNIGDVYIDDTHSYISKYETQERIEQLQEKLKELEPKGKDSNN